MNGEKQIVLECSIDNQLCTCMIELQGAKGKGSTPTGVMNHSREYRKVKLAKSPTNCE